MTYEEFQKRKESTRVTSLPSASAKKSKFGKSRDSQTEKVKKLALRSLGNRQLHSRY